MKFKGMLLAEDNLNDIIFKSVSYFKFSLTLIFQNPQRSISFIDENIEIDLK